MALTATAKAGASVYIFGHDITALLVKYSQKQYNKLQQIFAGQKSEERKGG